jgi:hypothetical protein
MRYGSTTKATSFLAPDWKISLTKTLLFFIPAANPHSEALYPRVKKWLVEVDDDGAPNREIALDIEGRPLFRAPEVRDLGFWTDSDVRLASADLEPVTADEFERRWTKAERKPIQTSTANDLHAD